MTWRLDDAVARAIPAALAIRHDLHRHPETCYTEHRTAAQIQARLSALEVEFVGGLARGTGTLAWLPATQPGGNCIALRADIDALPIHEETGLEYASTFPGRMHACGHDGHTATLLATIDVLRHAPTRPHDLLFLFQPAEEGGAGGLAMVEDGALDGRVLGRPADFIYGLHGWNEAALGEVITRDGALMAATDSFAIHVIGRGAHAAAPHTGADPVLASAHVITALQSVVARNMDPAEAMVVTVANIHGGLADNVIPDRVTLGGTLRTLTDRDRAFGRDRIQAIAEGTAQALGCRAEVEWREGYPVTRNEPRATERFRRIVRARLGESAVQDRAHPVMGGEDFSYYGLQIPASFFFLGVRPVGEATYPNLHSPQFDFNDNAIAIGAGCFAALALDPEGLPELVARP